MKSSHDGDGPEPKMLTSKVDKYINNMKKPLKVFFCDLTYDTIVLVSDTIPINIGFIASYAKKIFSEDIEVHLFKYPNDAIDNIKKEMPDLICLSNYSWNSNLSEHVAGIAKKINPNIITAQGGPNLPHNQSQQIEFIKRRSSTDIFMVFEGEITTSKIIKRLLETNLNKNKIFAKSIEGTVFLKANNNELVKGNLPERIKDLDEIPSPYLNGLLDKFFDGRLTPFLETNRGCPFTCAFCHTGVEYFQKINMFSLMRIREEIDYISRRCHELGITNLHIADTNFGMYPRDGEVTKYLLDSHNKYQWPMSIMSTTGKNNKKRVIEITKILGNMFTVNMSAQSMDEKVLKNIRRSNISLDTYIDINKHLKSVGRSTKAELIMLLPGETKSTFIEGIQKIIETGVSSLTIYTLMMLYGTEFKNDEFRKRYGYVGKYRIVPLNYGEYDNKKIFDYEEVAVENNDITFAEYLSLRGLALLVETLLNGRPFEEFFNYAQKHGISRSDLLTLLQAAISKAPDSIKQWYQEFITETREELWDKEEDLLEHYQKEENYLKLKEGLVGGNLIYKYKCRSIAFDLKVWVKFIADVIYTNLNNELTIGFSREELKSQISNISTFCLSKLDGIFDLSTEQNSITILFDYHIVNWLDDSKASSLVDHKLTKPIAYTFGFTEEQLVERKDRFDRYGSNLNALSKIVTRISNLESCFRKVKIGEQNTRDVYADTSANEMFTKYTIAN